MIDDVLATLPTLTMQMRATPGSWLLLGVLGTGDDAGLVRAALGPDFEIATEPFEAHLAVGGHQWIRPRTHWEVWGRAQSSMGVF